MLFLFKRIFSYALAKIKAGAAFLVYKIFFLDSKNYWLIGGSLGECFDDNAGALLKYLREYHSEVEIYWISNRNNPDIEQIKRYCPVIIRYSFKADLMVLRAEVLLCTHSIEADIVKIPPGWLRHKVLVYLEHGVRGLKIIPPIDKYFSLAPSCGKSEMKLKESSLNSLDKIIIPCGIPQHDELLRKQREFEPGETGRTILFLPTWRKWLVAKKQLLKGVSAYSDSEYFKHVSELLTSDSFNDFLEERDLTIKYLPHRNMRVWADILPEDSRRVKVLPPETSVQDEIVCSDALITDYSSVAWEFLLLDKPVIFYQFDREKYLSEQGSFVDFNTDLFGPAVFAIEELKNELGKLADADFVVSLSEYDRGRLKEEFVGYSHGDNCRIITEHIFDSLKELK
jgi:CDP-glycerol glycerophosphotransferase (TagB/SpsB family)